MHFPRRRGRGRERSPDRDSPLPLLSQAPTLAADEDKYEDKDEDKDKGEYKDDADADGAVWSRRPPGVTIRPVVLTDSPSELSLNMASAAAGPVNEKSESVL